MYNLLIEDLKYYILFISEEENVVACMIRLREKENFAASKKNKKEKTLSVCKEKNITSSS